MTHNDKYHMDVLRKIPEELSLEEVNNIIGRLSDIPIRDEKNGWKKWFFNVLVVGGIMFFMSIPYWEKSEMNEEKLEQKESLSYRTPSLVENYPKTTANSSVSSDTTSKRKSSSSLGIDKTNETQVSKRWVGEDKPQPLRQDSMYLSNQLPSIKDTDSTREIYTSYSPNKRTKTLDINGKWNAKFDKDSIHFVIKLEERGKGWKTNWRILVNVHESELEEPVSKDDKSMKLIREAGEMIFDRRKGLNGLVKFSPDPEFMSFIEQEILDVEQIPLSTLSFSGSHQQDWEGTPIYSNQPYALLWLKFYLANINREYIAYLESQGYQPDEMEELWRLADVCVPISYLKQVLPTLKANLSPEITLGGLAECHQFDVSPELIQVLASGSYPVMSANQLVNLRISEVPPEYISEINKLDVGPMTDSLLALLYQSGMNAEFVALANNQGYTGLSAQEYLKLKMTNEHTSLLPKKDSSIDLDILNSKRSYQVEPFQKLVASGKLRIVLKRDTINQLTVWGKPNKLDKIHFKVKNGILKVSPKMGFKPTHTFDILISNTSLEEIESGSRVKLLSEEVIRP